MFRRVIIPIFLSLIILLPLFIYFFWYFNGILTYLATGDGRDQGVDFLINHVASVDDPSTNEYDALDFIGGYINPMIVFSYGFHNAVLLFWLILGRFLKVNKPGVARRYKFYWYVIALLCCLGLSACFYFYMDEYDGFFYMQEDLLWPFIIGITICSFILFYLQSLFFTSKVMMIAIPFVGIFKSISFRRNKDDD